MAKVSYVLVPPGMEDFYKSALKPSDRFFFSSVRRQPLFTSRKRKKALTLRSLTPEAGAAWDALSISTKDAWTAAGLVSNYKPFQVFLRDYASRKKNGLSLPGSPSVYVQNNCLRCEVASPATGMRLVQEHPFTYYVLRKVTGTRNQYNPVLITELFSLPLELVCRFKSDLTSAGPNPSARFYAIIYSNYQGRAIETLLSVDIPLSSDWDIGTVSTNKVLGVPLGYAAYIEIIDARGTLDLDNLEINHSAQNWVRDPRCDNSRTTYTKQFYQIARNWVAEELPAGTDYGSIYYSL